MMLYEQPRDKNPTFAEPGEGMSYLEAAHDFVTGGETFDRIARVVTAAERSQIVVDNTYAREEALDEAAEKRVSDVQQATGVQLQNFARVPPTFSTMHGIVGEPEGETARDMFHRRLQEIAAEFPEHAAAIRAGVSVEDDAAEIARSAEADLTRALADRNLSTGSRFLGALAGGVIGGARDPLMLSTLFAGGGPGTATTVAGRIGQVALREAFYNAGATALAQPRVQAWREEAGLRSGLVPAIENVGFAAVMGAIVGGPLQGVREIAQPARDAIARIFANAPEPGDVRLAARALDVKLDGETRAAVDAAEREAVFDAMMRADRPETPLLPDRPQADDDFLRWYGFDEAEIRAMDPERRAAELTSAREAEAVERSQMEGDFDELTARVVRAEQGFDDPFLDPTVQYIERVIRGEVETRIELPPRAGLPRREQPQPREGEEAVTPDGATDPVAIGARRPEKREDVLDLVPLERDDGTPVFVTREAAARAGERDGFLGELVRSCKA